MKKFAMVWDDRYHCPEAASWLSTRKQIEVAREVEELRIATTVQPPYDAGVWQRICQVHDEAYVRAVGEGRPRELAESQGFRWSPRFADAVSRIWSGHEHACRLALEMDHDAGGGVVFHPVSGAHHAGRSRGSGFCTFNFLVGGARLARPPRDGSRAASVVVDLDTHQGNGTYVLAGLVDAAVALFDISGTYFEVPAHATPTSVYKVVRDAAAYSRVLDLLPYWLHRLKPRLVQYQAGMDCHEGEIGGVAGADAAFLAARDRLVIRTCLEQGIPIVVNLAGGYQENGVTVGLHVRTAEVISEEINR